MFIPDKKEREELKARIQDDLKNLPITPESKKWIAEMIENSYIAGYGKGATFGQQNYIDVMAAQKAAFKRGKIDRLATREEMDKYS